MELAVVFLPLVAAALAGFGRRIVGPRGAEILTSAVMVLCALLSIAVFHRYAVLGKTATVMVMPWLQSGTLSLAWSLRMDVLTAVMMLVVTLVSAAVHVYSIGYMHEDPWAFSRFLRWSAR